MDSRERHELKHNDLQEVFFNFKVWWSEHGQPWWDKNGTFYVTVFAALAIGLLVYNFWNMRTNTIRQEAWADLALTTSPDAYRQVAAAHDVPTVKALSYLRGGELLSGMAITPAEDDTADPAENLEQARRMYEQVLATAEEPVFRANALLGLAAVAETQQDWEAAREYYARVQEMDALKLPGLIALADKRLSLLPELEEPVYFSTEVPADEPEPATDIEEVEIEQESDAVTDTPTVEPVP